MSKRNWFRRSTSNRPPFTATSHRRRLACERLEPRLVLTPVSVTITSFEQIDDPDEGKSGSVAGDYFAEVSIR